MYHGYHFVILVLFQFIFYGILVKKTLPEDKKKDIFESLHKLLKKMSLIISLVILFIMKIRFFPGKSIAHIRPSTLQEISCPPLKVLKDEPNQN